MSPQDRKTAVAAYKERKPAWGVYAVICTATGEAWVGASRHVSLQAAWSLHGEAEFRFEELERLSDTVPAFSRVDELKKRRELWRARLQASALRG
jgi:hypothetical protein